MGTFIDDIKQKNQQDLFSNLLKIQTESYGFLDEILLSELIRTLKIKKTIDVGTGEGSFLKKIAKSNPEVEFIGIESNQKLADEATNSHVSSLSNIRFINKEVGDEDLQINGDLIITRLVLQHSSNPLELLKKLILLGCKNSILYLIEPVYDYYDCDPLPIIWREYRERLILSYKRLGSEPNLPKRLSGWLSSLGCTNIRTSVHFYSCSTIGKSKFSSVVRATAATLHSLHPDLWSDNYINKLDIWLELIGESDNVDPYISIAHTRAELNL